MKMNKRSPLLLSALVFTLIAAPAWAMRDGRTSQGQPFLTGGIGSEERDALKVQREYFNLRVLTAAKGSGAYLSDVRVTITDSTGRSVLETVMDGPWLYVQLLPGAYQVRVVYNGATQQQSVELGQGADRSVNFYFNEEVERLPPGQER